MVGGSGGGGEGRGGGRQLVACTDRQSERQKEREKGTEPKAQGQGRNPAGVPEPHRLARYSHANAHNYSLQYPALSRYYTIGDRVDS
jgi:hypothetical protein